MRLARDFPERASVVLREPGVALGFDVDFGQIQAVGERDGLGVEVGAADEEDFVGGRTQGDGGGNGGGDHAAVLAVIGVAGDDDVGAPGQRAAERFEGLAAHEDGMVQRQRLEVGEVFRQPPRQAVFDADDAVFGEGGDDTDAGFV